MASRDKRPYPKIHQLYRGHDQFRDPQAGAYKDEYCSFLVQRYSIMGDLNAVFMLRDNVDIAEQVRVKQGDYRQFGVQTVHQARHKQYLLRKPNPERPWHPAGKFVTPAKCAIFVCMTLPVQL